MGPLKNYRRRKTLTFGGQPGEQVRGRIAIRIRPGRNHQKLTSFPGHNFGVAVEAVVQTQPQLNDGMHFVSDMEYPVSSTEELFKLMNEISTPDLPPQLAFFITAHYKGKSGRVR